MFDVLIFDFNNIYNVNYYKFSHEKDTDGSGAVYNSLLAVNNYIGQYRVPATSPRLIFALDTPWFNTPLTSRHYRRQIYPEYKANRLPKDPGFVNGIKVLAECIKYAYHNSLLIGVPGFEADDVVEPAIEYLSEAHPEYKFVLISNDGDWFARLRPNVSQCQWYQIITEEGFTQQRGFPPRGVMMEKMIRGDASDNIPKSVLRLPTPFVKHIANTYKNAEDMFNHLDEDQVIAPKWKQRIREQAEAVYRNEKLVRPLMIPKGVFLRSILKAEFDRSKLLEILFNAGCETSIVDKIQALNGELEKGVIR